MSKREWVRSIVLHIDWNDDKKMYHVKTPGDVGLESFGSSTIEACANMEALLNRYWEDKINRPKTKSEVDPDLETFYLSENHIKLLPQISWRQNDNGSVEQDWKYPYGDSDTYRAIQEAFHIYPANPLDEDVSEAQFEDIQRIAREMVWVMKIGCQFLRFEEGWYVKRYQYGSEWDKLEGDEND